ncbi:hypothetical protein KAS31_01375 [Candidatus Parcubacteria bacterium]|nr:hypothetical protein [Candidatus Parcubacteria bacterium]
MAIELETSELIQLLCAWIIIIISSYAHEIGHYTSTKYYFPNADSKFVWTWAFLIPTPHKVVTENFNKNVTIKEAFVVLSMGPIAGLTIMIILSYFLLNMYVFIALLVAELFASSGDFKKICITIKEVWEKKKTNQGI